LVTVFGGYGLSEFYLSTIAADAATVLAGKTYLFWFIPGMPMGVAGAGLASTISVAAGVIMLWVYFVRLEHYVAFDRTMWRPRFSVWKRMLSIGFPAGGEFILLFVFTAIIYWTIRDFGSSAQAGFGLGSRIMQSIFLPAMAVAFAATFLKIISWNFVPAALVFTCSGMFQALGNTWPALLSTGIRLITFAMPAIWLSTRGNFQIEQICVLSAVTVLLQAVLSLALMRREMRLRLAFQKPTGTMAA
jgi:Na+-driven multidrug efflux pump